MNYLTTFLNDGCHASNARLPFLELMKQADASSWFRPQDEFLFIYYFF